MTRQSLITLSGSLAMAIAGSVLAQAPSGYDALVRTGNQQLQSGNNEAALTSAQTAIRLNPERWQARALAGAALINLNRCDDANTELDRAAKRAPEQKQVAIQSLKRSCVSGVNQGSNPDAGPTFAETVRYLREKVRVAGVPGSTSHGRHGDTSVREDTTFTLTVEGCDSLTVNSHTVLHEDDPRETPSHTDSPSSTSERIPFRSIAVENMAGSSVPLPRIFSTHSITANPNIGQPLADGFGIAQWGDLTKYSYDQREPHDTVFFVANDAGVTQRVEGADFAPQSYHPYANVPLPILVFWLPGTGETSTHVAKALAHLVTLCLEHPDQAPKEPF